MKMTIPLLAVVCALALLPVPDANAGHGSSCRITGYTPCGKPIHSYFHVHGYDRCGNPVGHWVQQYPSSCRCRYSDSHSHGGHFHNGHSHGGSYRPSSGWSFFFRF